MWSGQICSNCMMLSMPQRIKADLKVRSPTQYKHGVTNMWQVSVHLFTYCSLKMSPFHICWCNTIWVNIFPLTDHFKQPFFFFFCWVSVSLITWMKQTVWGPSTHPFATWETDNHSLQTATSAGHSEKACADITHLCGQRERTKKKKKERKRRGKKTRRKRAVGDIFYRVEQVRNCPDLQNQIV